MRSDDSAAFAPPSTVTVTQADHGTRLDKCLAAQLPHLSRSRIQGLIAQGQVALLASGAISDPALKVKAGQRYRITLPDAAPSHIAAQEMPLRIVYEDAHLLVLDKPPGLTVHPAPGHPDKTLVNALLAHCGASLSGIGGVARPGIVHRIDKDTSGLLAVAKHDAAHASLSAQLKARTLTRVYLALAWGTPSPAAGTIRGNIGRSPKNRKKMAVLKKGGREAVTHYKTLRRLTAASAKQPFAALLECRLETGRTHQIRVHLAHAGHAIVGDPLYGTPAKSRLSSAACKGLPDAAKAALLGFERQALHAARLALIHPVLGKEMAFEAELPEDMQRLLNALEVKK